MEVVISQRVTVAAFDFDGTLTTRDTLLPFLQFVAGTGKTCRELIPLIPSLLAYGCGLIERQEIKERVLTRFLSDYSFEELCGLGSEFADKLLASYLKKDGMQRLQWHLDEGHRCVLVSAAIDIYLKPWGKQTGFHDVICSRCAVDGHGRLTGLLEQENCWGEEKVKRLTTMLGQRENYVLYAYGDSRGDRELLALADYAFYRKFNR